MLDPSDADQIRATFGVAEDQVRRDHLLSHLLGVLSAELGDAVIFFGGTALARTHLPGGRLSEDLDLLAVGRRATVAPEIERRLASGVRREYGRLTWDPPLTVVPDTAPAVLRTTEGLTVRVQLLDQTGYPRWPTERRLLEQRYRDAPPATLEVPTLPSFAASKTTAWHDRAAPRDLYDLWGLATVGALDEDAAQLFARLGPTGQPPAPWMFDSAPTEATWSAQLAAQTRLAVPAEEALRVTRDAWAAAG